MIHLGGIPGEAPWPQILEVNIDGTYKVFEAARRAGVGRVMYASSNHAVGFRPRADFPVPDYAFPAPDTYYGVSKVAGEALGSLYHYRYGLDSICIRILTCAERPPDVRSLSTWLSPDDAGRLFEAACPRRPRLPGDLRRLGEHPRRLGVAGRGAGARLSAPGRRRGVRDEMIGTTARPNRRTRCSGTSAASSPCPAVDAEIPGGSREAAGAGCRRTSTRGTWTPIPARPDRIAGLGLAEVALAAAYPAGAAVTPFHPRHRMVTRDAAVYYRAEAARWRGRRAAAAPADRPGPFERAAAALRAAGWG